MIATRLLIIMSLLLLQLLIMVISIVSEPTLTLLMVIQRTSDPLHVTRTITSAAPHINSYHIMYMGDDGNDAALADVRQSCKESLAQLHGDVHTTDDVTVDAAGNHALKLATDDGATFALWLEPGDELPTLDVVFHQWVQDTAMDAAADGFTLSLDYQWRVPEVRLVRLSAQWRFAGSSSYPHLLPVSQPILPSNRIQSVTHITLGCARDVPDDERRRFITERLVVMCDADTQDSLATFYLASILAASGNNTGALFYYQRRWTQYNDAQRWYAIETGSDNKPLQSCRRHEEAYVTMMSIASLRDSMGASWSTVQSLYHDAYGICSLRAEPLVAIAMHWFDAGKHALAFLHASRAVHLSYPAWARLTVDTSVYQWRSDQIVAVSGWAIGQLEVGARAVLRVQRYMRDVQPMVATTTTKVTDAPDADMIQNHVNLYHTRLSSVQWQQMEHEIAALPPSLLPPSRPSLQWLTNSNTNDYTTTSSSSISISSIKRRSRGIPSMGVTRETMPSFYHWCALIIAAVSVRFCLWPAGFTAVNRSHRKPAI